MTALGEELALQIKAVPSLGLDIYGFYDDRAEERCHPIAESLGGYAGSLKDAVDAAFNSVRLVGVDLIATGFILFASRFFPGGTATLTPLRAFIIGLAQALFDELERAVHGQRGGGHHRRSDLTEQHVFEGTGDF